MQPMPLPAVVAAGPNVGPGNQAMRPRRRDLPPRAIVLWSPVGMPFVRPTFAANQPQPVPASRRPIVTGKYAAGSVIPGGASQYLPRPPEASPR